MAGSEEPEPEEVIDVVLLVAAVVVAVVVEPVFFRFFGGDAESASSPLAPSLGFSVLLALFLWLRVRPADEGFFALRLLVVLGVAAEDGFGVDTGCAELSAGSTASRSVKKSPIMIVFDFL